MERVGRHLAAALAVSVLSGCASAPTSRQDPFEPFNRKMFAFNEALDEAVLKPVSTAYQKSVPSPIRTGVSNFFGNVFDLWSAVNLFLQGRVADGVSDVMRFSTNTALGLLGFIDIASEMGLERHNEDLGQTLGKWGMPPGPYLYFPVIGPSSARDALGVPIELGITPDNFVTPSNARLGLSGVRIVSARAKLLGATGMLDDIALDKYTFVRDAYLQRRRSLVYDGNPPDEADDGADSADPASTGK